VTPHVERLRETERWIAWVRLAAVPFAIVEVGLLSTDYPSGYERLAWLTTALLALGGALFYLLSDERAFARAPRRIGRGGSRAWRMPTPPHRRGTGSTASLAVRPRS